MGKKYQTKSKSTDKNNVEGFSLLELLTVLVILAALAVIAVPTFMSKGNEARLQAHKANIKEITNAVQRYEWSNGELGDTYYNIITYTQIKGSE